MSLKSLFRSQSGSIPKILFLIPVLIWIGVGVYWVISNKKGKIVKPTNTVAIDLQSDINYISSQAKGSEIFSLSKKDMIHEDTKNNFLMQKVKRQLDKSVFAQSMGSEDGEQPEGLPKPTPYPTGDSLEMPDLNHLMQTIQQRNPPAFEQAEKERKERLEQAKADNRKRRLDLEHGTAEAEVAAYRKGMEDTQDKYQAVERQMAKGEGLTENETLKQEKTTKKGLGFSTAMGIVDDLKMNEKETTEANEVDNVSPVPIDLTSQKNLLKAVIDQPKKYKQGDKIQLRILEEGLFKGKVVPQNTLLYGICALNANRLLIRISSVTINGELLPANLSVYDLDGMQGIFIEGALQQATNEVVNEALNQAGQIGLRNPLGNLSIQLGRKANLKQSAFVPGGYRVLLVDEDKG